MTREQRFTFNEVGEQYDRYRPGYPESLFEDLLSLSGISPGDRILEIGCGTGQATKVLARRGFAMSCLEPGSQTASIARTNLEEFPGVDVLCTTFEAWPCEPAAFGLVFAAQAFHWVPSEIGFAKAAQALRPDGALAVFGNMESIEHSHHGDAGGAVSEALDSAYSNHAPSLLGRRGSRWYAKEGPISSLFPTRAVSLRQRHAATCGLSVTRLRVRRPFGNVFASSAASGETERGASRGHRGSPGPLWRRDRDLLRSEPLPGPAYWLRRSRGVAARLSQSDSGGMLGLSGELYDLCRGPPPLRC